MPRLGDEATGGSFQFAPTVCLFPLATLACMTQLRIILISFGWSLRLCGWRM